MLVSTLMRWYAEAARGFMAVNMAVILELAAIQFIGNPPPN
ncbi:hypothetical protein ACX12L_04330 [Alicycliphilus sp. T452]|jgi:hypothetical protein